jgi:hypothetical protein
LFCGLRRCGYALFTGVNFFGYTNLHKVFLLVILGIIGVVIF